MQSSSNTKNARRILEAIVMFFVIYLVRLVLLPKTPKPLSVDLKIIEKNRDLKLIRKILSQKPSQFDSVAYLSAIHRFFKNVV
jgi:hypothetical protein